MSKIPYKAGFWGQKNWDLLIRSILLLLSVHLGVIFFFFFWKRFVLEMPSWFVWLVLDETLDFIISFQNGPKFKGKTEKKKPTRKKSHLYPWLNGKAGSQVMGFHIFPQLWKYPSTQIQCHPSFSQVVAFSRGGGWGARRSCIFGSFPKTVFLACAKGICLVTVLYVKVFYSFVVSQELRGLNQSFPVATLYLRRVLESVSFLTGTKAMF